MGFQKSANRNRYNILLIAAALVGQLSWAQAAARAEQVLDLTHDLEHLDVMCIATSESSAILEAPVTQDVVLETLALDAAAGARFQLQGTRWTSTRTHPNIPQGEPFFLTYSFVLDGTSIPPSFWETNQVSQNSNLFATMNAQFPGGMDGFRTKVREAFDQWQDVSNFRYVEVPDDGAAFTVANGGLVPTPTQIGRGDIRIAMRLVDGNGVDTNNDGAIDRNVLAYNSYPGNGGDMVLDSAGMPTFLDSTNDYRRLKNVLLHEHGHGLGLMHVMPQNNTKLMEPALNTNFDGPQEDDIRAIASLYGDPGESNNTRETAIPVGSIADGQPAVLFPDYEKSLERNGAEDWYKFTASAGSQLTVTLDPIGTTYQQGAQPLDATVAPTLTTVNALAARDLRMQLCNPSGTVIGSANNTAAGQSETIVVDALPVSGTYSLRVYSTDNGTQPQRYQFALARQSEPEINVVAQAQPAVNVPSGGTFNFADTTVNSDRHNFFTIENDGSDTLSLTNNPFVAIFGTNASDFTVNLQPSAIDIAAGDSVSFNIGFRPSATGTRTATVLISNNDADESAYVFTVTGTGVGSSSAPGTGSAQIKVFQVTPAFQFGKVEVIEGGFSDFPEVEVGNNLAVFYFIENHGTADLVLSGNVDLVTPTSGFTILSQPNGFPIPAGNPEGFADNFRVRFTPVDTNTRTTRVFIYSNASNTVGPFDFTLRGAGTVQIVDCNGNGIDDATELTGNDCNANGIPDECDTDADGDSVPDACDLCDGEDDLRDTDGDGTVDCLDGCPADADKLAPGNCGCGNEESADCGIAVCPDGDDDGDGVCNSADLCPGLDDLRDLDADGTADCLDNDITPELPPEDGNPDDGNPDDGNPDDGNPDDGNPDDGNPVDGNPGVQGICGTGVGPGIAGACLFACFSGSFRRRRRVRQSAR
ncbi:MAG: choice-of-anchor D domain-containing protein [Planctomycetes bacterium]|nr:choice-of-anchor D domain-containing protein [Planctomycetota bacterium]